MSNAERESFMKPLTAVLSSLQQKSGRLEPQNKIQYSVADNLTANENSNVDCMLRMNDGTCVSAFVCETKDKFQTTHFLLSFSPDHLSVCVL